MSSPEALFAIRDDIEIQPFDSRAGEDRYLVTCGGSRHLVSRTYAALVSVLARGPHTVAMLRNEEALRDIDVTSLERTLAELPDEWRPGCADRAARVPLFWTREVIRAEHIQRICALFGWMLTPTAFVAFCLGLLAVLPSICISVIHLHDQPLTLPVGFCAALLLTLSVIIHEFGHATAAARFGAKPGAVGIGLYLAYPSMYTNVSDTWRLSRAQRVGVDLSGMYFQGVIVTVAAAVHMLVNAPALVWFEYLAALSVVQTLNPFFKMDGYWILSDAFGIPNLHRSAWRFLRSTGQTGHRAFLATYLACGSIFSVAYLVLLAQGMRSAWTAMFASAEDSMTVARAALMLLMVGVAVVQIILLLTRRGAGRLGDG